MVARSLLALCGITHRRIGEDAYFAQLCSVNARNLFFFSFFFFIKSQRSRKSGGIFWE